MTSISLPARPSATGWRPNPPTRSVQPCPELLSGVDLSMVNFESALTDGTCPESQSKQSPSPPRRPPSGVQGRRGLAHHRGQQPRRGLRPAGLQMASASRAQRATPILGIGQNVAQAFAPYETTINGQKIAIIAATQVIDSDLQAAWTATATQPGLASAYDVDDLVAAVEAARKSADTVDSLPPLGHRARRLPQPRCRSPWPSCWSQAGADIVVGTHAHVLLGGGYLGSAYVDYGLGNFAFYDNSPPENASGSLVITATGRHIDSVTWRPAVIVDDLPQPLTGPRRPTRWRRGTGPWLHERLGDPDRSAGLGADGERTRA